MISTHAALYFWKDMEMLTAPHRSVWLRGVHPEDVPISRAEVSCGSDVRNRLLGIVDDQGVGRRKQRNRGCGLVFPSIPGDSPSLLDTHVARDGVDFAVQAAGRNHVNGGRRHDQGCVVPLEGNVFADFVIGRFSVGRRRNHLDSTRRKTRVDTNTRGSRATLFRTGPSSCTRSRARGRCLSRCFCGICSRRSRCRSGIRACLLCRVCFCSGGGGSGCLRFI